MWGVRERNRGGIRALNRANPTPRTRPLLEDLTVVTSPDDPGVLRLPVLGSSVS